MNIEIIKPVQHGLMMAVLALILGALWAAFMAVNHESLHNGFEQQQEKGQQVQMNRLIQDLSMEQMDMGHPHGDQHAAAKHVTSGQHSHSGSLAKDAMQRLLRGHIHFMGIGVLAAVLLLITAFTSLKSCWKKLLGWTLGLGALAYPVAWIVMGFRTVELGPEAAEASILWLFGPAVGLLLASMVAVFAVLIIEAMRLHHRLPFLACFFVKSGNGNT